jgi:hypothetical protein
MHRITTFWKSHSKFDLSFAAVKRNPSNATKPCRLLRITLPKFGCPVLIFVNAVFYTKLQLLWPHFCAEEFTESFGMMSNFEISKCRYCDIRYMRFDVLTTVTTEISVSWNVVPRAATATFLLLPDYLTPCYRTHFSGTRHDWSGWLPSRTLEARFQFQGTSFGFCGGHSGIGTGFSPSAWDFPYQYNSTDPARSYNAAL